MTEEKVYPVPAAAAQGSSITRAQYDALYRRSIQDPKGFWAEQAREFVSWIKPWDQVLDWDYRRAHIRWFEGG